jgi:ATP-dependent Clp protease ATP-binding subunit ClpA
VLQLSLREALRDGARQIGTEHILLGMLRDEASAGASVLTRSGVTRRKVEDWLADQAV